MKTVRTILLASLLVMPACTSTSDRPQTLESEIIVRTMLSIWESADTAAVLELFWPEAVYDDFPNQIQYQGVAEIASYLTYVHSWGTGVYMNVTEVHASETSATAEWVLSVIQDRPMGELVPEATGREVVLNGVTIIEIDGGLITRAADYVDIVPMVLQLGGRIEYPGGTVLELEDIR
jgi:steroid delta-isomerase-like uncharacterized protein